MKKKFLFLSIGVASFFSCAVALLGGLLPSKNQFEASAGSTINVGELSFTFNSADSNNPSILNIGLYLLGSENEIPYDHNTPASWDISVFTSSEASALKRNDTNICTPSVKIKKISPTAYFLDYGGAVPETRNVNDSLILQGNWTATVNGDTYNMSVEPFKVVWDGSKWSQEFMVPELETYDRISLAQIASDDYDHVKIDTEKKTSGWNTFTASPENTTNSFAFEFIFESYSKIDQSLEIRFCGDNIGTSADHFFVLALNNTWGPHGVIVFDEYKKVDGNLTRFKRSGDLEYNLEPGARHTIECASIVVKDSSKVYHYVKYDGELVLQQTFVPKSSVRTPRVAISYGAENIFLGGTIPQKTNTDVMTFDSSNASLGLFLNGPTNDIPVLSDWQTKGAPASSYNMLKNGEIAYRLNSDDSPPLTKFESNKYYISFSDIHISFVKNDVMTISGEFHFYANSKAYTMALVPFSVKFNGSQFELIDDLDEYLIEEINSYVLLSNYTAENQALIESTLLSAQTNIGSATTVLAKWTAFKNAQEALDAIPMIPEKLQEYKNSVIAELEALVDENVFEAAELAVVQGYVNDAIDDINDATNVKSVQNIAGETKDLIAAVETRQDHIEAFILSHDDEADYNEYLETYEVVTTTDICAVGNINFYPKDDAVNKSYPSNDPDSIYSRFATSPENEYGNVKFRFNYRSTDPTSRKHEAQVFVRLRGNGANCYIFDIARGDVDGHGALGVGLARFVSDTRYNQQNAPYAFEANHDYTIECGAIDLVGYERTVLYMDIIDGNTTTHALKTIVDRQPISILSPTILFMDSHTADSSGESISLSPCEDDVTKSTLATSIGRPILENNSSSESLLVSLRSNSLPIGAQLYPMEKNAYLYKDNEIASYLANPVITKLADKEYSISLSGLTLENGDTIKLHGCFAYYDTDSNVKSVYKLSDTVFTYNSATNSWSQSAPTLPEAKEEAIAYLTDYVTLSDYSATNQTQIQGIINNYTTSINNATSNQEVESLLSAAVVEINAIPTILSEYKNNAKSELSTYKSASLYRDSEKAELTSILNSANTKIDACTDTASIDAIVTSTKQEIDALKTAAQYEAEELASEKKLAKTEIETFIGLVELDRYDEENVNKIQQLALQARSDADKATSIEEIRNLVAKFKEDIKKVTTKDGSIFNGETYVEAGKKNKSNKGLIIGLSVGAGVLVLAGAGLLTFFIIKKKKHAVAK